MAVAVSLVRAYLELSGYFVLSELPVRALQGQLAVDVTDLDIVAVRFPHPQVREGAAAKEPLDIYLGLDPALGADEDDIDVIIGEVKEGPAQLNPGLRRVSTIAFAIRRLGCCPEDQVMDTARRVLEHGETRTTMAPGLPCRVRLVAFGGSGEQSPDSGAHVVSLSRCAKAIEDRMHAALDLVGALHFEDPVLGLFALRQKLGEVH